MPLIISFILSTVIFVALGSTLIFYLLNGIASTPSSYKVRFCLRTHLPSLVDGDIVEAGAGWGGMSLWLARLYPNNTVYAWENAWLPFVILWLRVKISRQPNICSKYGHFRHHPVRKTGLVYAYLCRKGMQSIKQWIDSAPTCNVLLISNAFMLPDQLPNKTISLGKGVANELYLYNLKRI